MRQRPTIVSAFEHRRVSLPPKWNTAFTRERLEQAGNQTGLKVFETRGREIHALGVVGVIDIGDLIVQVLPKTNVGDSQEESALFLSDLLCFVDIIDGLAITEARTHSGELTIMEVILSWALREAERNIREGLPRRYKAREELSSTVRGRIEMRSLARCAPGKAFELHVRHAPLSYDNALSQTIKWVVAEISERTFQAPTRRLSQSLVGEMGHIESLVPSRDIASRLTLQSSEGRWQPLISFADQLLRQQSPNPSRAGAHGSIAVLFRLHTLFERVLRRIFAQGMGVYDLALKSSRRMLLDFAEGKMILLRPDYLFGAPDKPVCIIGDAKWKQIFDGSGRISLSERDAYQLTTYLASHRVATGIIFCPLMRPFGTSGIAERKFMVTGLSAELYVIGVQLPQLIDQGALGEAARLALCKRVAEIAGRATASPL